MQEKKYNIAILMATYNGERYISSQLESIINQTEKNWKLIISDDASSDKTLNIINEYAIKDTRITILEQLKETVGACKNFDRLIKHATNYKYIMFADQDDIWFEKKIEIETELIKLKEKEFGLYTPLMVYSNFYLSDANLNYKKKVYKREKKLNYSIFINNWILGCTMVINNPLIKIVEGIPDSAQNHDQWIACIAQAIGWIDYVEIPTMIHRIHNYNATVREDTSMFKAKVNRLLYMFRKRDEEKQKKIIYLQDILERINRFGFQGSTILNRYSFVLNSSNIKGMIYAILYRIRAFSFNQTILFYLLFLTKRV